MYNPNPNPMYPNALINYDLQHFMWYYYRLIFIWKELIVPLDSLVLFSFVVGLEFRSSLFCLPVGVNSGLVSSGGVPLHSSGLQLLQEVLQQGWRRRTARHEVWRHVDSEYGKYRRSSPVRHFVLTITLVKWPTVQMAQQMPATIKHVNDGACNVSHEWRVGWLMLCFSILQLVLGADTGWSEAKTCIFLLWSSDWLNVVKCSDHSLTASAAIQSNCSGQWLTAVLDEKVSNPCPIESWKYPMVPVSKEETTPFMDRKSWVRAYSLTVFTLRLSV